MTTFLQDLSFGARVLAKNPGFTLVAALTLALGIGANSAIFSIVNGVLLVPLPFQDSHELVLVEENSSEFEGMSVSYPNFLDWRQRQKAFVEIAAHRFQTYNVTGQGRPELIQAVHASADLFPVLKVEPLLGRVFVREEDQAGAPPLVVLSYGFWQRRFGGDESILGDTLTLDGSPYEIVGVMPREFSYPLSQTSIDCWTSIGRFAAETDWMMYRGNHPGIRVTGRLMEGVSLEHGRRELASIASALAQEYPDTNDGNGVNVDLLQERLTRNLRPALLVLIGAVSLVLLIACVNVANLQLARAASRAQEVAVRSALGAGRGRLIRQMLTESFLLALLGAALGLGMAQLTLDGLLSLLDSGTIPSWVEVQLDRSVLAFTLAVSVISGILFGLAPALQSSRGGLSPELREGVRSSSGPKRQRTRSALVAAEVALAMVLLFGSALFLRSFGHLISTDPGFEPERILTFQISLSEASFPEEEQQIEFFTQLREKIASLPGTVRASHSWPLLGGWQSGITVEGQLVPRPGALVHTEVQRVGPEYFETVGLRLLRGRFLNECDREDSTQAAVVDKTFADRFWPGQDPLGKRFMFGRPDDPNQDEPPEERWIEVVGVVNHVKTYGVDRPSRIQAYLSSRQSNMPNAQFLVKTDSARPESMLPQIEQMVSSLHPDQPIARVSTMEERMANGYASSRLAAGLLTIFAALALILSVLGIYGVMSYAVAQRRQEMGIRLALGAHAKDVLRLVVLQGMRVALLGIAIGLSLAVLASPLVASLLFQVSSRDPGILLAISTLLTLVAAGACALPALKASKVDPVTALRRQ